MVGEVIVGLFLIVVMLQVSLVLKLLLNLLGVHLLDDVIAIASGSHEVRFAVFDLPSLVMGTQVWRWLLLEESKDGLALLPLSDFIHAIEVG